MLSPDLLADLHEFLVELNRASGLSIAPLFRADHGLADKGGRLGFDPVTEADKGAERDPVFALERLIGVIAARGRVDA